MRQNPQHENSEGIFIRRVLIVFAFIVLALVLWRMLILLPLIFAAVVVAVLLHALAGPLHRALRLPTGFALALAVLLLLGILAAAVWMFGSEVGAQVRTLAETLPDAWQSFERRIGESNLDEQLRTWLSEMMPSGSGLVSSLSSFAVSLGVGLLDALLIIVGGIYLAAQPDLYRTGLLKLVPRSGRELAAEALDDSGRALRLWLLGQLVMMIFIGVLTSVGLWWLGVPSAIALGLLAGLLEFVPIVGPIAAAIPALLIALAQDTELALWTLGFYIVLQQLEGNVLQPLVQQRAVDLPPALLLFSLVAAGLVFGIMGILLAAPLTVLVYVLVKRLYVREALDTPTPVPGEDHQEA